MTDVALQPLGAAPGELPRFDLALTGAHLATDEGLYTAVVVSLFTDRRAKPDDRLPDPDDEDRRGWWGDAWPALEGDRIGSRLWLLRREKQTQAVVNRAREYAEEALAWLVEDGVARAVRVTAEVVRQGVLGLFVTVERPSGNAIQFRFSELWEAL